MADIYYTIIKPGEGIYKEKMSKFLAFALPVYSPDEAKEKIKEYQNLYHDARHVCWAYMLGPKRDQWQLNDNGEPSGTAGKPILGQINSFDLTNVIVIVVRYFGGIKLGTSGLIQAYREAARLALEDAGKKEMHHCISLKFRFSYETMNQVMKLVKSYEPEIKQQVFDNLCLLELDIREDLYDEFKGKLTGIEGLYFEE